MMCVSSLLSGPQTKMFFDVFEHDERNVLEKEEENEKKESVKVFRHRSGYRRTDVGVSGICRRIYQPEKRPTGNKFVYLYWKMRPLLSPRQQFHFRFRFRSVKRMQMALFSSWKKCSKWVEAFNFSTATC